LYKHALESIFSHLTLSEIARTSAVCRDWSAAVDSMRPIGASVRNPLDFQAAFKSRLMRHVLDLHISGGALFGPSLAGLCDAIRQSKLLATLGLFNNYINKGDAVVIADAIKQSKSLTTVNMYGNAIGDDGAIALAEVIKQSTSLVTVGLMFNDIGTVGALAIAEAIKQSRLITKVNLDWNSIGSIGRAALTDAIKHRDKKVVCS